MLMFRSTDLQNVPKMFLKHQGKFNSYLYKRTFYKSTSFYLHTKAPYRLEIRILLASV